MVAGQIDLADFLQRFSVKVLWHFTGYGKDDHTACNVLKKILSERELKVTQHPEDVIMPSGERRWVYPYSCLCDIPFKDLRIHTIRYGRFGIAFKKPNAIVSGHFNPVFYVHKDHYLFAHAGSLLSDIDKLVEQHKLLNERMSQFLGILGVCIKRSDLMKSVSIGSKELDQTQNSNFYYEREWRSASNWRFGKNDIEAVMAPKDYFGEIRLVLDTIGFQDITLLSHESLDTL